MGTCLQDIEENQKRSDDSQIKFKNSKRLEKQTLKIIHSSGINIIPIINEDQKLIKQKHINGRPNSMSIEQMKYLINKMEKCVCKIINSRDESGTGFICNITNEDNSFSLPALLTCNHILKNNDIILGNVIKLEFNDKIKTIKIHKLRTTYTSEKYDTTIIEINKIDNFNQNDLLRIDKNIFNKELSKYYKKRQIYLIHYPKGKEMKYSCDLIKTIEEDNFTVNHLCSTDTGSSGAPMIELETGGVIGIHIGYDELSFNLGTIIKDPIYEFIKLNQNKQNEITLKLEIKKEDINKEIYFLDNINYVDDIIKEKKPNSTLTELNETNVMLYINNNKYNYNKYFKPEKEGIYTIKLVFSVRMTNCVQMFHGCNNIINIDLSCFNTEKVTNMEYMFSGCINLKDIDLSSFNTDYVINMQYMFYNCKNLEKIDLSNLYTGNTKNISGMFSGCNALKNINLSNFDTQNVIDISNMFYNCENLINLDISNFNTKNVTNMSGLLYNCQNLSDINLSSFDTSNVVDMNNMFYFCSKLTSLNLTNFNTEKVENMKNMFYNCNNLKIINLTSFNTKNVKDMGYMFSNCKSLIDLDLSSFHTDKLKKMYRMFYGCENLCNLDISSFNCSNVDDINNFFFNQNEAKIFGGCNNLKNPKLSKIDSTNNTFDFFLKSRKL